MIFKTKGLTILMVLALMSVVIIGCEPILLRPEIAPHYPGGDSVMMIFIKKNLSYPEQAKQNKVQGRAATEFVVEKDGSLSHFNTLKSVGYGCDEAVIEMMQSMPKWIPAKDKGKPVRAKFILPVDFKLE